MHHPRLLINHWSNHQVAGSLDFETSPSESIIVRASSTDGSSVTQDFSIIVTNVNEAPVAAGESFTVTPGQTLSVEVAGVVFNDSDVDGDSLSLILVTSPSNGMFCCSPVAHSLTRQMRTFLGKTRSSIE